MGPLEKVRAMAKFFFYALYLLFHHVQYGRKHEVRPEGKVRVSRILFKYKLDIEEISKRQDFIATRGEWQDLEVLNDPKWFPYTVERDRAFFVLLPKEIDHYRIENYPFMYVPVYKEAKFLAEVARDDFMKLADKFNARKLPKTILFTNTARGGSTLMGKMLDHPGTTICFGEPHVLVNLSFYLDEQLIPEEEIQELLEATVACLRAHVPSNQICVLKTTSGEARLVRLCEDIPKLKHMFMFRYNGLPSVERMVRSRERYFAEMNLILYNAWPPLARFIAILSPCMEGRYVRKLKPDSIKLWSAIVYASPYHHYLKNQTLYCHPAVQYHELLTDTSKVLVQLFTALEIPLHCVEAAVKCKDGDSQKNSHMSRDLMKDVKARPLTDSDRRILKRYAKEMEVPEDIFE